MGDGKVDPTKEPAFQRVVRTFLTTPLPRKAADKSQKPTRKPKPEKTGRYSAASRPAAPKRRSM